MKTVTLLVVTLCASATAYADFSYTTTRKAQGPTAAAAPSSTKYYYKGQKMMTDSDATTMIMDFDAQTVTTINKTQKTWSVMKFSDVGQVVKQADIDDQDGRQGNRPEENDQRLQRHPSDHDDGNGQSPNESEPA